MSNSSKIALYILLLIPTHVMSQQTDVLLAELERVLFPVVTDSITLEKAGLPVYKKHLNYKIPKAQPNSIRATEILRELAGRRQESFPMKFLI